MTARPLSSRRVRAIRCRDAIDEQRAVRQPGHRIVEGLVRELLLEALALADIATVEHDAAYVLVVGQVRVEDLELARAAVAVAQRAFEHLALAGREPVGQQVQQPTFLAGHEQASKRVPISSSGA